MGFRIDGLDELQKELARLSSRMEKADGEHGVTLPDLMSAEFMRTFTDFLNLEEMFEAFGKPPGAAEEREAMFATPEWNAFIADRTLFSDWQEMFEKAGAVWVRARVGIQE